MFRSDGFMPYVVLLALCASLYLPGIAAIPPIDRDEARFAQATRQMIDSHDYVRIRFQDEPRNKKPIGIYWLQAAAVSMSGSSAETAIWPYRLPSCLGATLAVLLTFAAGRRLFDSRRALLGAGLLAASLLLIVEAHQATTDAALLAAALAAQGALGLLYCRPNPVQPPPLWIPIVFWAAQGVGILLKGPIVPAISALTIAGLLAADRNAAWLKGIRPVAGIILAALIVSPWAIAVNRATGGAFFHDAVTEDLLPKLISGQESHGFVPGYYLLLLPLTFWPASAFIGLTLHNAWENRLSRSVRFCLAWIVPSWIMFELVPTKLPHYILPVYPALALLTANAIFAVREGVQAWPRYWPSWLVTIIWAATGVTIIGAIITIPWYLDGAFCPAAVAPAAAAVIFIPLAIWMLTRERPVHSTIIVIVGTVLIFGLTLQQVFPNIRSLWLSRMVAGTVRELTSLQDRQFMVASAGYQEPSLVFALGPETQLVSAGEAASFLAEHPDSLVIVDNKSDEEFLKSAAEASVSVRHIGVIRGFHYTKGRWITLRFYVPSAEPRAQ